MSTDLVNCVFFQNGDFSLRKEFAPRGSEFFPLRAVPFGMKKRLFLHYVICLEHVQFSVSTCINAYSELCP